MLPLTLIKEAKAFLADVECTSPYAEPLAITTTMAFEVSHEDAYDFDVDEAPHAAAAFMANLMQTCPSTRQGTSNDTDFHSETPCDVVIDDHDHTIPYHQYQLKNEVESIPTDVSSVVPSGITVITILDDLRSQLAGHIKTNKEQCFANNSLKAELERYKTQLDKEYDQYVIDKKSLEIENKKTLIQNECLLAESVSKDICSVVLTSDIAEPMSVEPRSNCVKKHSRRLELEAEILKKSTFEISASRQKMSLFRKFKDSIGNIKEGIKSVTNASKSKYKCETKTHWNFPARSENVKRVDNPLRNLNKRNRVDSSLSVKRTGFILKSVSVCKTCNECLVFGNHNKCGVKNLNSMNAKNPKVNNDATVKQVWKATGKIFASVGSKWRPTGRKFTLGDTCPLTRITKPEVVPLEKSRSVSTSEPANNVIVTPRFSKKPLTSYKHKDRKLKDISTSNPPNPETKAVNDPVNVNDLSANQLDPKKNWVSDVPNSTASVCLLK
ncbi:hypothetical protein Tco_0390964 [Tanacetum coccineum]